MGTAEISVALYVYNGANYIEEALQSVLDQDCQDFELVVSDGGSLDETPQILAEYAARDSRMRVFRTERRLHQWENVNHAIELCKADWVKIFVHDDLLRPDCLSTILRVVREEATNEVGLIGSAPGWLFANGYVGDYLARDGTANHRWHGPTFIRKRLAGERVDPLPSMLTATIRREAYLASDRFDKRLNARIDNFFFTKFLMDWDYIYIAQSLTTTRVHSEQITNQIRGNLEAVEMGRFFWPEFLEEYAEKLELSRLARLRTRLKPVGEAGTIIAIRLLTQEWMAAIQAFLRLPVHWWPIMPLAVIRSLRNELIRTRELRKHVPIRLIY